MTDVKMAKEETKLVMSRFEHYHGTIKELEQVKVQYTQENAERTK